VGILIAVQICERVDVYGYNTIFSSTSHRSDLSYYSGKPVGMRVFDITSTRSDTAEAEAVPVDNAIMELLEIMGHIRLRH